MPASACACARATSTATAGRTWWRAAPRAARTATGHASYCRSGSGRPAALPGAAVRREHVRRSAIGRRQRRRPRRHRPGRLAARRSRRCGPPIGGRRGARVARLAATDRVRPRSTITQDTPYDPRHRRAGDEFGAVVESRRRGLGRLRGHDRRARCARTTAPAGSRSSAATAAATRGSANSRVRPGLARRCRAAPSPTASSARRWRCCGCRTTAGPTSRSPPAARTPPTSG